MEGLIESGLRIAERFPGGHVVRTFVTVFRLWYNGVLILPYASIICIILGLLYFVSPLDIIPDALPIIGYIDDVAVLSCIVYYVIPMFIVNNLIRRFPNIAENTEPIPEQQNRNFVEETCVVCMDSPTNIRFEPCSHQACCSECSEVLGICP